MITAKKLGYWVQVRLDENGHPYCPCGCGEPMVEVRPGEFQCPDGYAVDTAMRKMLAPLMDAFTDDADQDAA